MVKKILLVLLLCCFYSCENKNKEIVERVNPKTQESLLLKDLSKFNQLKLSNRQKARSWYGEIGRFCAIASADIVGGFTTGKIGAKVGVFFGPKGAVAGAVIGGAIGAIGGSYSAYRSLSGFERNPSLIDKPNILLKDVTPPIDYIEISYLLSTKYPQNHMGPLRSLSSSEEYCEVPSINKNDLNNFQSVLNPQIDIPDLEFKNNNIKEKSIFSGQLHNIGLDFIMKKDEINLENYSVREKSPIEKKLFESNDLCKEYENVCSVVYKNESLLDYVKNDKTSPLSGKILDLFLELFNEYPTDLQDVKEIAEFYINKVEESTEINDKDKQILCNALTVAYYSFNYWSVNDSLADLIERTNNNSRP